LYAGNKLFKVQENTYRELLHSQNTEKPSNEVWLALSLDKDVEVLKGLSLFFNLYNHSSASLFYNALQSAEAFLNGHSIQLKKGYSNGSQFELDPETMLATGNNYTQKVFREVAFKYANRFIHIDDNIIVDAAEVPAPLQAVLPNEIVSKLSGEDLVFIRIVLNKYFAQDVFDGLHCSINAFPAVNLRLHTQTTRTDDWANIIPLSQEGLFFDLKSIKSEDSSTYRFRPAASVQELEAGEVILSASGIGRTNSREVREMIGILSEAIRDQSAYFEDLSNEFIHTRLKEINQLLTGLEDQLSASKDQNAIHHYLLLRPKKESDLVVIDYWTTEGVTSHQLKAGLVLNTLNAAIHSRKALLLTQPNGGRNNVAAARKKELLRQQLTSRGKIVTADDIKVLCKQLFGDRLSKAEVHKGIQVSADRKQGFTRSIDVMLYYSPSVDTSMKAEMDELCRELEYYLQVNGSPVYPYRIIVETEI
ncbi:MAG TPA: hypothetical protein VD794_04735, partial [Flavisolibacter sp.]|nr:hypothetical protein [Flavisolibacter sp.]